MNILFIIFKKHTIKLTIFYTFLFLPSMAWAQIGVEYNEQTPHHFSVLTGGTDILDEGLTGFTLGGDYEYRINRLLGLGVVLEHAFGAIDATTILGVTDVHIWKGFVVQLGAGVEFIDREEYFVARVGALYEFEFDGGYTIAPQVHYDISHKDSLVFGTSYGVTF